MGSALCSPVPMFPAIPGTDVPRYLCSLVPMFPEPMFPGTDVPRYLCSPVPMFPEPMFPCTYVPRYVCSPNLCSPIYCKFVGCSNMNWNPVRTRLRAGVRAYVRVRTHHVFFTTLDYLILDMHPLAAASRSRLLCSKRPINMRSALNVSLRKTWMSDIALNKT